MPNWVTNKVKAPRHVISFMLNDKGDIDFNRVIVFEGEFPWDGVSIAAERLAEAVTQKALSDHPLLRLLEARSREEVTVKNLDDESFEQFIQMLRNFRKCGMLHHMDFARKHWGTKWNACEATTDLEAGTASFDTAWSCPRPVLEALSQKFPDESIEVQFADEDIGSNCGSFTLKAGEYIATDIAPAWRDQTDEQKSQWEAFARSIKGWESNEEVESET